MAKARIGSAGFQALTAEKAILREAKSGNPLAIQKLFVSYQGLFCYAWQKYHPADVSLHDWLCIIIGTSPVMIIGEVFRLFKIRK